MFSITGGTNSKSQHSSNTSNKPSQSPYCITSDCTMHTSHDTLKESASTTQPILWKKPKKFHHKIILHPPAAGHFPSLSRIYTHTYPRACTRTHAGTHRHTRTHNTQTHTRTREHAHTHTHTHTRTHAHAHTHAHSNTHTHTHHARTHARTVSVSVSVSLSRTHKHTHIHTHAQEYHRGFLSAAMHVLGLAAPLLSYLKSESLQHTAEHCTTHCNTTLCNTLQHTALQRTATHCNTAHCNTSHCNTAHCHILQL